MRELGSVSPGEFLRSHLPPLFAAAVAIALLIITPFWARDWYRTPFLGIGLEHFNVINHLQGEGWGGHARGLTYPQRLVALDDTPVLTAQDTQRVMKARGFQRELATIERLDGTRYTVPIVPIRVPFMDLLSLFIVPWSVGAAFIAIGLWTYTSRPFQWESRALLLFVSGAAVMLATFLDVNSTHHATLWFSLGVLVAAGGLVYLALVFPVPVSWVLRRPSLRYLPWLMLVPFVPPSFLAIYRPPDPFFLLHVWQADYVLVVFGFVLFIAMLISRLSSTCPKLTRQQSRVILFGAFVGFTPVLSFFVRIILDIGPPFRAWVYFPPLILFPLAVTYAILRFRLLDIDALLARAITYAVLTFLVVGVFFGLSASLSLLMKQIIPSTDPRLVAIYLLFLVMGLVPLRDRIQRWVDLAFYRAPADHRAALERLSHSLLVTPNLSRTMRLIEEQLQRALGPGKFLAYLYSDDYNEYYPHATQENSAPPYPVDDPLIALLQDRDDPVWFPPDGTLPDGLRPGVDDYSRLLGYAFVPLHYERKLIGFLALGPRRSGDLYRSDDLEFLAAVGAQSTLALENARLFTNQGRILDETREMKNLMDDIFASMASGVITTDLQRRVTLFNRAAEQVFRIAGREAIGRPVSELTPCLGGELDRVAAILLEGEIAAINRELCCDMPDGRQVSLRVGFAPLRDARLETKGVAIVFEDVSERRRLEAEQERIRQTFGRVVAPRVRDRLLADGRNLKLDGITQTVSIVFADLTGFSTYSELHAPDVVFPRLNSYLSLAANAILEQEGTLDKFMGDAAMAIWNAPDAQPDHAWRAVRAAHEIVQRSRAANREARGSAHKMVFRIGISTGSAMVGNVGTDELFNYTAIGDAVNIAQRLQTHADAGEVLLEHNTYEAVAERVVVEPLRPLTVKGREQPVQVYRLKGLK